MPGSRSSASLRIWISRAIFRFSVGQKPDGSTRVGAGHHCADLGHLQSVHSAYCQSQQKRKRCLP
jgi:hypothetical protein